MLLRNTTFKILAGHLICVALLGASLSEAKAANRDCSYQLYVKANGTNSIKIDKGLVRFRGNGFDNANARQWASHTAKTCLKSPKGSARGGACDTQVQLTRRSGIVITHSIVSATEAGLDTICSVMKRARIGTATNIRVFAKTISRSSDVRRECALSSNNGKANVYTTVYRTARISCR